MPRDNRQKGDGLLSKPLAKFPIKPQELGAVLPFVPAPRIFADRVPYPATPTPGLVRFQFQWTPLQIDERRFATAVQAAE
jgi:hypothetical protein